jgi:putative alpha-1,2-mannosidase
VQLSPVLRLEGWDGCGGYHYDDNNYILWFSHTHLSGTGIPVTAIFWILHTNGPAHHLQIIKYTVLHSLAKMKKHLLAQDYYSVLFGQGNIKANLPQQKEELAFITTHFLITTTILLF